MIAGRVGMGEQREVMGTQTYNEAGAPDESNGGGCLGHLEGAVCGDRGS